MSAVPALPSLVRAESIKLLSRTGVRVCLAILALVAVGLPVISFLLSLMITVGPEAAEAGNTVPSLSMVKMMSYVLALRNFFLFRAMVIAIVAVSFAGEFTSRTLREDLIRPVTRAKVLAAKWLALQVFVVIGALVPLVLAAIFGAILFGVSGSPVDVLVSYLLTWLGDVGFSTLVMAISLGLRSVPGTIGGVFMYWVADKAVGVSLWAAEQGRSIIVEILKQWGLLDMERYLDLALAVRPWLPSAAFDVYFDYSPGEPLQWQSYVALLLYTAAAYVFSLVWFRRLDVD